MQLEVRAMLQSCFHQDWYVHFRLPSDVMLTGEKWTKVLPLLSKSFLSVLIALLPNRPPSGTRASKISSILWQCSECCYRKVENFQSLDFVIVIKFLVGLTQTIFWASFFSTSTPFFFPMLFTPQLLPMPYKAARCGLFIFWKLYLLTIILAVIDWNLALARLNS